jgi:hypothetical protein
MSERGLLRLAALTAIAGGLFRIVVVVLPGTAIPAENLQQFYFVTDFFLLLGCLACMRKPPPGSVGSARRAWQYSSSGFSSCGARKSHSSVSAVISLAPRSRFSESLRWPR